MTTYTISPLAYLKLVFHAAKYPASTVTGLLIGTVVGSEVTIVDALPLLHHWTTLSPMMQAGLELVRSYLQTPAPAAECHILESFPS